MLKKNIWILVAGLAVIVAAAAYVYLTQMTAVDRLGQQPATEELTSIELSEEERALLESEGINLPSGTDENANKLKTVSSSDELGALESDVNNTELSGIDEETNQIDSDLQGM